MLMVMVVLMMYFKSLTGAVGQRLLRTLYLLRVPCLRCCGRVWLCAGAQQYLWPSAAGAAASLGFPPLPVRESCAPACLAIYNISELSAGPIQV